MIPTFHSYYPADVLCILSEPSFLTCQYISHCMSNLTNILLVDYLVVVWVCFFLTENLLQIFPNVKAISVPIFLNSHFIFGLMLGIQGNFFRFLYSQFSVLFSWLFLLFFLLLCFITNFFKSCLLWPFSTKISSKKFSSSLIHFSEHIECACKGNL